MNPFLSLNTPRAQPRISKKHSASRQSPGESPEPARREPPPQNCRKAKRAKLRRQLQIYLRASRKTRRVISRGRAGRLKPAAAGRGNKQIPPFARRRKPARIQKGGRGGGKAHAPAAEGKAGKRREPRETCCPRASAESCPPPALLPRASTRPRAAAEG